MAPPPFIGLTGAIAAGKSAALEAFANLGAETSDNVEVGVRTAIGRMSLGVTGFFNFYDGFIQQVALGVNPATRLLEYQYQNLQEVTIKGLELRGEYGFTDALRLRAVVGKA